MLAKNISDILTSSSLICFMKLSLCYPSQVSIENVKSERVAKKSTKKESGSKEK